LVSPKLNVARKWSFIGLTGSHSCLVLQQLKKVVLHYDVVFSSHYWTYYFRVLLSEHKNEASPTTAEMYDLEEDRRILKKNTARNRKNVKNRTLVN
jgi:hypothetical protein